MFVLLLDFVLKSIGLNHKQNLPRDINSNVTVDN